MQKALQHQLVSFSLEKPFPITLPKNDGCIFDVDPSGLPFLVINFNNLTQSEFKALKDGITHYSIYKSSQKDVIVWVFKFPSPIGYIDAPFHAGLYDDDRIRLLLETEWNALQIFVVDRGITKLIRLSGLSLKAVNIFNQIISNQSYISRDNYNKQIDFIYQKTSKELFRLGATFKHSYSS